MIETKRKKKMNCWEFMMCGRGPDGARVKELGVCPAVICREADGIHGGKNAGRCCWVVAGAFCREDIQGQFAKKILNCLECPFHVRVLEEESGEEGDGFLHYKEIVEKLKPKSKD